jgi:hypothetical protein
MVALEMLAELAQLGGIGIRARLHVLPTATDVDVLCQNPNDFRPVGLAVAGECRQQQLLLRSEVARPLALEEVEKDAARLGRAVLPSALELQGREQALMMLVRQHSQGLAALHSVEAIRARHAACRNAKSSADPVAG